MGSGIRVGLAKLPVIRPKLDRSACCRPSKFPPILFLSFVVVGLGPGTNKEEGPPHEFLVDCLGEAV